MDENRYQELLSCIETLESWAGNPDDFTQLPEEVRVRLIRVAGQIARPNRLEQKNRNKALRRAKRSAIVAQERSARAATGIRDARRATVFKAPTQIEGPSHDSAPELSSPRNCYVCNAEY
ncbi:MAG TPA: hypothetical protein PLB73_12060, partial [Leptospiraceae bacterium]|nr:hypothetical protein [Leptospiraceae bacterium]